MSSIFISYSTKDRARANEVFDTLGSEGFQLPFLDYHADSGIVGGSKWERELWWHVTVAKAVIVLHSESWDESKWCFSELQQAKQQDKVVIPLKIDSHPLTAQLSSLQSIEFESESDEWKQRLLRALNENGIEPGDDFAWPRKACPYPGLSPFEEQHAAVYFGREREIEDFVDNHLKPIRDDLEKRMIYVVGPSGSGKSSFIRAGISPRLGFMRRQPFYLMSTFRWNSLSLGGRTWQEFFAEEILRNYGDHPENPDWNAEERSQRYLDGDTKEIVSRFIYDTKDMSSAIGRIDSTPLIVIDQFEELLVNRDGSHADGFLEFLGELMQHSLSPVRCISTVRSDFVGAIQEHPTLIEWSDATEFFRLDLVRKERLFDIVSRPLDLVDVCFKDDAIANRIVSDAEQANALPLLAFTLKEFYERCGDDGQLTLREYEGDLGGIDQCLNQVVANLVQEASEGDAEVAAEQLEGLRLAFVTELAALQEASGGEDEKFVRRSAKWSELPETSHPLLKLMSDERFRLVSIDRRRDNETYVEVTHEALFRQWALLRDWLHERKDLLRWRSDVMRSKNAAENKWFGLTNSQYSVVAGWPDSRQLELRPEERKWFRDARSKRQRRTGLVAATILTFAVLSGVSYWNWNKAETLGASERLAKEEAQASLREMERTNAVNAIILDDISDKAGQHVAIHRVLVDAYGHANQSMLDKRKEFPEEFDTSAKVQLAENLLARAWHLDDAGRIQEAIADYRQSLELYEELSQENPRDENFALRCTFLMNNIGNGMRKLGDIDAAIEQQERTYERRQRVVKQFPSSFEAKRQIPVSLSNLATLYGYVQRDREAVEYAEKGLLQEETLWEKYPNNRWVGLNLSSSLYAKAGRLRQQGDIENAIEYCRRSYAIRKQLYEDATSGIEDESGLGVFNFVDKYGKICFLLAEMLIEDGQETEFASELLGTAISILTRVHKDAKENEEYRTLLASAFLAKSKMSTKSDALDDALQSAEKAVEISIGSSPEDRASLANSEYKFLRSMQVEALCSLATAQQLNGLRAKASESFNIAKSKWSSVSDDKNLYIEAVAALIEGDE